MTLKEITDNIDTGLKTLSSIAEVFSYPISQDPKKFPAIVFDIDSVDNSFETNQENRKQFNFRVEAYISVSGLTTKKIHTEVIPKVYDDISDYIDENWNRGTLGGHRVWARLSLISKNVSIEQNGQVATLSFSLQVQALKDN